MDSGEDLLQNVYAYFLKAYQQGAAGATQNELVAFESIGFSPGCSALTGNNVPSAALEEVSHFSDELPEVAGGVYTHTLRTISGTYGIMLDAAESSSAAALATFADLKSQAQKAYQGGAIDSFDGPTSYLPVYPTPIDWYDLNNAGNWQSYSYDASVKAPAPAASAPPAPNVRIQWHIVPQSMRSVILNRSDAAGAPASENRSAHPMFMPPAMVSNQAVGAKAWGPAQVVAKGNVGSSAGASPLSTATVSPSLPSQNNWRWCQKCQGLFFSGNPDQGVCPAGGVHDASRSGAYLMTFGAGGEGMQAAWRWCHKCQGLFFSGNPDQGVCPAGGVHDASRSGAYLMTFGAGGEGMQAAWRWCHKCQGLFFSGNPNQGACPAGAAHDPSRSGAYSMRFEISPVRTIGAFRLTGLASVTNLATQTQSQPVDTPKFTMSFDYCLVRLRRAWFSGDLLATLGWYVPGAHAGDYASGPPASTGPFAAIPTAFIAVKNLLIDAAWSDSDVAARANAASFGPFSLLGSSTDDKNSVRNPGVQIIAWICSVQPQLPPDTDPSLVPVVTTPSANTPPSSDSGSATQTTGGSSGPTASSGAAGDTAGTVPTSTSTGTSGETSQSTSGPASSSTSSGPSDASSASPSGTPSSSPVDTPSTVPADAGTTSGEKQT